jgi:hypothetical protein
MKATPRVNPDRIGAWASGICAVHCVLTGLAIGLLSALGLGFMADPLTDALFLGAALLIGGFAVWHGIRKHGSYFPSIVFAIGMALVFIGHFVLGHSADGHESVVSSLLSAFGGLTLVAFHLLNYRLQQLRGCCHEAHCKHTPH